MTNHEQFVKEYFGLIKPDMDKLDRICLPNLTAKMLVDMLKEYDKEPHTPPATKEPTKGDTVSGTYEEDKAWDKKMFDKSDDTKKGDNSLDELAVFIDKLIHEGKGGYAIAQSLIDNRWVSNHIPVFKEPIDPVDPPIIDGDIEVA